MWAMHFTMWGVRSVHSSPELNSRAAIATLVCLFTMGPMYFLLMPLYVGALVDHVGLSNQQVGTVTSLELFGSCLASLSALLWIRKINWRRMATAASLALVIFNLVSTTMSDSLAVLMLLRAGAGFCSGSLLAVSVAALGDTARLDRNFALAVATQLGLSGVLFFVLPQFITQQGVNAVFTTFAACALLALMASFLVPSKGRDHILAPQDLGETWRPMWGLAGCAAFYIAQTGFWAFVERMGVAADLSAEFIGLALGFSTLASIGGALGVGWLTLIFSRFGIMAVAALGQLACLALLIDSFSANLYLLAVLLFQICWNAWLPLQMANVAAVDTSGRFTVLLGLFQAIGGVTGPLLVTGFLTGHSFLPVNIISAIFIVLTLCLFAPIALERSARGRMSPVLPGES